MPHFDVLILGSGAAGLSLALRLDPHYRIGILSKGVLTEGCTMYAQGGISAVMNNSDSIESHVRDTMSAGAGLCNEKIVRKTVGVGKPIIEWLINLGVNFTHAGEIDGSTHLHLTREGGHSQRRVVHATDATGKALEETLISRVKNSANITTYENHIAIDLLTTRKLYGRDNRCLGAYVQDCVSGHIQPFTARFVVLATGGASKVYLYTSNPDSSSGDGIAMAWRAGCRVANMEFVQFHPTCLYHPSAKSFLISEAVRGEGAKLILPNGSQFMQEFDPRGELAPRDIVARAIDYKMKQLGLDCVYLDISHKSAAFIQSHFPNIYERCLALGYDITKAPIPVVPAAHYTCGGVMTDENGTTDIDRLYAIGETAHTGLHGANRMASNSLLECLAFASFAAQHINSKLKEREKQPDVPPWDESRVTDSDEEIVVSHNWDELRRFMWDYVGIVRTTKRLERAKHRVDLLKKEIEEYYSNFRVTGDLIELRNLTLVAELIIKSALRRKESRGLHYTLDHPHVNPALNYVDTILDPVAETTQIQPARVAYQ